MNKRTLIVLYKWPSQEHPYLIYLFAKIKKELTNVDLFVFGKGDNQFGEDLLGKEVCDDMYTSMKYKFHFTLNPFHYFIPFIKLLLNLPKTWSVYRKVKQKKGNRRAISQIMQFNEIIASKNYEVVYFNALQIARHFEIKALFPDSNIIASSRGQDIDLDPAGYDEMLKEINHLHVLGNHLKTLATQRGYQKGFTIIPPASLPIDMKSLKKKEKKEHELHLCSASRHYWTKGYQFAFRALRKVIDEVGENCYVYYHLIGDGVDNPRMRFECERLGLKEHVIFHGWKKQADVNEIVYNSDIYVLLSVEEGFNNSVLQAQNLGIPCVVTNTGGLPENVIDDETGFVVNPYDPCSASESIIKLIRDQSLRLKFGSRAKERVFKEFSLESQTKKYLNMLDTKV